jgi:ABC-2 type transport system permease protein
MKALLIAQKNIKEVFRNLKNNAILFVLPLAFIGIFGLAFGKNTQDITFEIGYVNNDSAVFRSYIEELDTIKNGETDIFKTKSYQNFAEAKTAVEDRKQLGFIEWKEESQSLTFHGDSANSYFGAASGVLSDYTNEFFQLPKEKFKISDLNLANKQNFSYFHELVPGLIVYAILLLIIQTAQNLSEVKEKKQVFRYFTSKTSALDIMFGYLLSMSFIALLQTIILFAAAYAFGFRSEENIFFAFIISLSVCFFAVGIGLLIGAFVGKPEPAANLGSLISLILGFFSGSFILGIENIIKFGEIGGRSLRLVDFVPTFYATQAMKEVLLYGKGYESVLSEVSILIVSSLLFLALGIFTFNKRQLSRLE